LEKEFLSHELRRSRRWKPQPQAGVDTTERAKGNPMQDVTVPLARPLETSNRPTFRRGKGSEALLRAARRLLDGFDPEDVGLREIARRTGVSAAAAYKHFVDKDDLMASVATQGFHELARALRAAADEPDPAVATGLAYMDFARTNRGLFRLMFGPLLAVRRKYPALSDAADEAFGILERSGFGGTEPQAGEDASTKAALGVIHGLSALLIANVLSEREARALAQEVLENGMPRR
jgi:AcrR family transcriptional regulator